MTNSAAIFSRYGALELKRVYQKNMATGMLSASAAFIIIIGVIVLITGIQSSEVQPDECIVKIDPTKLGAPPTLSPRELWLKREQRR